MVIPDYWGGEDPGNLRIEEVHNNYITANFSTTIFIVVVLHYIYTTCNTRGGELEDLGKLGSLGGSNIHVHV